MTMIVAIVGFAILVLVFHLLSIFGSWHRGEMHDYEFLSRTMSGILLLLILLGCFTAAIVARG